MRPRLQKNLYIQVVLSLLLPTVIHAQPAIQWQKCFGTPGSDVPAGVVNAWDDGFVIGGTKDICQSGPAGFWIIKTDDSGNVDWEKCYGGSLGERVYSIVRVKHEADSGYLMVGNTTSNDGDVTGNHGGGDIWVVRTDVNGNLLWQKTLGGTMGEYAWDGRRTPDGGYIIVGNSSSNDGDVSGQHGLDDMWIVKLSDSGSILWQRCLGGTGHDEARGVAVTHDGSIVAAGRATFPNGDISATIGGSDYWVVKLSSTGALIWEKTFGGFANDYATSIVQTSDSGFILSGWSTYNPANNGLYESVLKLDKNGVQQWTAQPALTYSTVQTPDGGYVTLSGESDDFRITRLTSTGVKMWHKSMGGSAQDQPKGLAVAKDGGYVIVGGTKSNDGDVSGNHGGEDFWLVKLAPDPLSVSNPLSRKDNILLYPNPARDEIRFSEMSNVKLLSMAGQILDQKQKVGTLSLAQYPSGLYFVIVYDDKGQILQTDKVVKE